VLYCASYTVTYFLTYCRGDARIGSFTRLLTMFSHLCFLMNVEVTLFAVVLHHVSPSLLGSSLSSYPMHISVECQFRISNMIHFFAHDQNTAFAVAVCDVLRLGVDQPYHTPLCSWSCLCELLLQFSSNRTFQIPVICFPVFASKSNFQSCTSTHLSTIM